MEFLEKDIFLKKNLNPDTYIANKRPLKLDVISMAALLLCVPTTFKNIAEELIHIFEVDYEIH